jgi:hypothetical protein
MRKWIALASAISRLISLYHAPRDHQQVHVNLFESRQPTYFITTYNAACCQVGSLKVYHGDTLGVKDCGKISNRGRCQTGRVKFLSYQLLLRGETVALPRGARVFESCRAVTFI